MSSVDLLASCLWGVNIDVLLSVSEEQCLQQIYVDEQFGVIETMQTSIQKAKIEEDKKKYVYAILMITHVYINRKTSTEISFVLKCATLLAHTAEYYMQNMWYYTDPLCAS